MSVPDSLKIIGEIDGMPIGLVDATSYDPGSADNVFVFKKFYPDAPSDDYRHRCKHGIYVIDDDADLNSVCVSADGGHTGIHKNGYLLENDRLLLCCGDHIFCLRIPELDLVWAVEADTATCFEIFSFEDSYIVHGELEITRLDREGKIIWKFSGSDVFTTPSGRGDFTLEAGQIAAINWEGTRFRLDARTGKVQEMIEAPVSSSWPKETWRRRIWRKVKTSVRHWVVAIQNFVFSKMP